MALKKFGEQYVDIAKADGVTFEGSEQEDATSEGMERIARALEVDATPSPTSTGSPGQLRLDGTDLYVCVAPDTWVRFTVTTSWS